jgi:pyridoxine 4-dehydrogenase
MTKNFTLGGDLQVRRLGFGAMRLPFGTFQGPARDPETGMAVLRRALELGVDHIDTAGFYQRDGVRSNELIRKALAPYPDGLVIATKVGPMFDDNGTLGREAGPDQLRALVEGNLADLGLDRLDLVYLRVGGMGPVGGFSIGDRFAALAELRDEGLIRHLGVSNVDAAQLAEARAIAPVVAVQNRFGVHEQADRALLAECERAGIGFVPFFSLGGGGAVQADESALRRVAARHDATPHQIALAWSLAVSPAVLAIPGTGSVEHLEQNMRAEKIELTAEDLAELG